MSNQNTVTNTVTKPITVARQDLLTALVDDINQSGLPAFIVSGVLSDISASVNKLAQEQLVTDTQSYQEQMNRRQDVIYKNRRRGG